MFAFGNDVQNSGISSKITSTDGRVSYDCNRPDCGFPPLGLLHE